MADTYIPESSASGMAPQGWGANPTPAAELFAAHNADSSRQLAQWASYYDPTVVASTNLIGNIITKGSWNKDSPYNEYRDNSQKFVETGAAKALQTAIAMASMQGYMPGGSPAQMAYGLQHMMGTGGFSMGGGTFNGAGFVTDLTSRYMLDSVRKEFFSGVSGLGNEQADGMSKTDFGQIGFMLGRQGMFRGMDLGSMTHIGDKEQYSKYIEKIKEEFPLMAKQAQAQMDSLSDEATDLNVFEPNQDTFRKISDAFKKGARLVSEFRDVFGKDRSASDMLAEAEKLTGMKITESGAMEAAARKMSNMKILSQTTGMDLQAMTQLDTQLQVASATELSELFGGQPEEYARMAAASTQATWKVGSTAVHSAAVQSRLAQDLGLGHVPVVSQDKIMALNTTGVNRITQEEDVALEAMYAADTMSNFTSEDKSEIHKMVGELGTAKSKEERALVRKKISDKLVSRGVAPRQIMNHYGGDASVLMNALSQDSLEKFYDMAHTQEQSRIMDGTFRGMLVAHNLTARTGIDVSPNSESYKTLRSVMSAVGDELLMDRGGLADTLMGVHAGSKTWDDVTKFAAKNEDAFKAAGFTDAGDVTTKLQAMDQQARDTAGANYKGLGAPLMDVLRQMQTNPQMSNRVTENARIALEKKSVHRLLLNRSLGDKRKNSSGIIQDFIKGALNEGYIDSTSILNYMSDTDATSVKEYQLKDMALNVDEGKAKELDEQMGGNMREQFGVSSYSELATALGTESGTRKFLTLFDDPNTKAAMDTSKLAGREATLRIGSSAGSEQAKRHLERANEANKALALADMGDTQREEQIKDWMNLPEEEFQQELRDFKQYQTLEIFNRPAAPGFFRKAYDWVTRKDHKQYEHSERFDSIIKQAHDGDDRALKALTEDPNMKHKVIEMMEQRVKQLDAEVGKKTEGDKFNQREMMKEEMNKLKGSQEYLGRIDIMMDDVLKGSLYKKN